MAIYMCMLTLCLVPFVIISQAMRHSIQFPIGFPTACPWANARTHVSLHWCSVSKTALFAKHK